MRRMPAVKVPKPCDCEAWPFCEHQSAVDRKPDQKRITLHRSGRSWFALWTGPEEARIRDLCGTNDICTAFTAAADPEEVHAAISKLNPDYLVVINDL